MGFLSYFNGIVMMRFLVCCYILTAVLFALKKDWAKMVYWIGAATITTSVLFMK
jgi:hypothetical protein